MVCFSPSSTCHVFCFGFCFVLMNVFVCFGRAGVACVSRGQGVGVGVGTGGEGREGGEGEEVEDFFQSE